MPIGKVKWYNSEKGFGFVTTEDGQEVFLHGSALPEGLSNIKQGTKIDFSVVDGRRGAQVLSSTLVDVPPSIAKSKRKSPDDMVIIVEDLIKLLDEKLSNSLRRGKYPDDTTCQHVAALLRAVANDIDV